MKTIYTIKGGISKGVASLSFSQTGDRIAAVGIDDNHMLAVYDLKVGKGAILCLEKGDTAIIADI